MLSAKFSFVGPCWSESLVSIECKQFIQSLLQADPKKRLTAEQALAHPWLQQNVLHHSSDDIQLSSSASNVDPSVQFAIPEAEVATTPMDVQSESSNSKIAAIVESSTESRSTNKLRKVGGKNNATYTKSEKKSPMSSSSISIVNPNQNDELGSLNLRSVHAAVSPQDSISRRTTRRSCRLDVDATDVKVRAPSVAQNKRSRIS